MQKKSFLSSLPWPVRNWFFKLYTVFSINWGFSIPVLGISANSFGSLVVTNIGSLGLDTGYAALLPSSNVSIVLVMGGVQKKPVVVNDEVVIRRMISLTVVIDHRVADASHGGRLFRYLKQMVRQPEQLL